MKNHRGSFDAIRQGTDMMESNRRSFFLHKSMLLIPLCSFNAKPIILNDFLPRRVTTNSISGGGSLVATKCKREKKMFNNEHLHRCDFFTSRQYCKNRVERNILPQKVTSDWVSRCGAKLHILSVLAEIPCYDKISTKRTCSSWSVFTYLFFLFLFFG